MVASKIFGNKFYSYPTFGIISHTVFLFMKSNSFFVALRTHDH